MRTITSEADYEDVLVELDRMIGNVQPGTPAGNRYEMLASMVEAYEEERYPVALPDDPIARKQYIGLMALVVKEYDEAIHFYVGTLGFNLVEDTYIPEQDKRWVVVTPPGATESRLLLARAVDKEQSSRIGSQTGGRVFLFLYTDDFWRDYHIYRSRGVRFVRDPKEEAYGIVAVFADLYGNLWDLVQPNDDTYAND